MHIILWPLAIINHKAWNNDFSKGDHGIRHGYQYLKQLRYQHHIMSSSYSAFVAYSNNEILTYHCFTRLATFSFFDDVLEHIIIRLRFKLFPFWMEIGVIALTFFLPQNVIFEALPTCPLYALSQWFNLVWYCFTCLELICNKHWVYNMS